MGGYIDQSTMKNCYNPMDSYGEICVGCNCCGRFDKSTMYECRLQSDKEHLVETASKLTDDDFQTEIQQTNILKDIQWFVKRINNSKKHIMSEGDN